MSLATDQAALVKYEVARDKILFSQEYEIGDRTQKMALLSVVEANIEKYQSRVDRATKSGGAGLGVRGVRVV